MIKIKDWYTKKYPTDDLGKELNKTNTFEDLSNALNKGDDVYDTMGVGDSLIRERLFGHLSKIKGVKYDVIYYKWLYPDPKGMLTEEERRVKYNYAKGGSVQKRGREMSRLQKKWDNYRKDAGSQSVMIDDMPDEAIDTMNKQFLKEVREEMKKDGSTFAKGGNVRKYKVRDEFIDDLGRKIIIIGQRLRPSGKPVSEDEWKIERRTDGKGKQRGSYRSEKFLMNEQQLDTLKSYEKGGGVEKSLEDVELKLKKNLDKKYKVESAPGGGNWSSGSKEGKALRKLENQYQKLLEVRDRLIDKKQSYAKGGRVMSIERLAQKLERAYPDIRMRENEDSISVFEDFPTDRRGDSIADYYSESEDSTFGIKNHFDNFLKRNGYWAEWTNPGHFKIYKKITSKEGFEKSYAKGGELKGKKVISFYYDVYNNPERFVNGREPNFSRLSGDYKKAFELAMDKVKQDKKDGTYEFFRGNTPSKLSYAKGGYIKVGRDRDKAHQLLRGGGYYEKYYEETQDLIEPGDGKDTESGMFVFDNKSDASDALYEMKMEGINIIDTDVKKYAKGGEVEKKGNEMLMGGLAGVLLGFFFNK